MNCVKVIVGVLVLWSSTAWGATLTWNANSEPDLEGISRLSVRSATLHAHIRHSVSSGHVGKGDKFQYRNASSDSILLHYGV